MLNNKYSNVLTIILVIVIIAIISLLGFWGYDVYRKYYIDKEAGEAIEEFDKLVSNSNKVVQNNNVIGNVENPYNSINSVGDSITDTETSRTPTFKGFAVAGKIEIPKTDIEYPILAEATGPSIEVSVAILVGPGLNKPGNTVIVGHNYRNGLFFSNNKKIAIGDKIYITDLTGKRVTYIVYNTYETTAEDSDYVTRDTNGGTEISLSTCTDYDSSRRIIIWARAE